MLVELLLAGIHANYVSNIPFSNMFLKKDELLPHLNILSLHFGIEKRIGISKFNSLFYTSLEYDEVDIITKHAHYLIKNATESITFHGALF